MSATSLVGAPFWQLLSNESIGLLVGSGPSAPSGLTVYRHVPVALALDVPMVRAARFLVERAIAKGGLKLTPKGFLNRADASATFDSTDWPDFSNEGYRRIAKYIDEREVRPLHRARVTAMKAGLLVRRGPMLVATKAGARLLDEGRAGALLAALTEASFWKVPQETFDGVPFAPWPQDHVGVALWSLGLAATHWQDTQVLTPLCTLPFAPYPGQRPDEAERAFFSRVLYPALCLGILELDDRRAGVKRFDAGRFIRKTPLFDMLLSFSVDWISPSGPLH